MSVRKVKIILILYWLRLTVLDESVGVKDRLCSASESPFFFRVQGLTPTMKKTRPLLAAAFKNIFSRYTDRSTMRDTSIIPEAQMWLYPVFKNPDKALIKIFESTRHS
ncbi:hypothetical protein PHMEG_0009807 [Phytophthora megakarya]|uniref:Secreted protein n=1 Tax=Phytophthora megakarya TaxID=4795 RepID=A0A225WFW6_9STRA|nr:hypothetical protein PHMEG_0009807 [Phytophthora megakarya]